MTILTLHSTLEVRTKHSPFKYIELSVEYGLLMFCTQAFPMQLYCHDQYTNNVMFLTHFEYVIHV